MAEAKNEITAELFSKINSIPCEHVVLNPNIDSPYDHYIEFLKELQSHYSPEKISEISRQSRYGSELVNGSIPPSLIATLAFARLNKIVNNYKEGLTTENPTTTSQIQPPAEPKQQQEEEKPQLEPVKQEQQGENIVEQEQKLEQQKPKVEQQLVQTQGNQTADDQNIIENSTSQPL